MPGELRSTSGAADAPLARRLARATAELDARALPPPVVAKAKLCVLDWLACALAAGDLPWSRQALAIAAPLAAETGGAGIVGAAQRCSAQDAAFANGVRGHGLVRDDMHVGSVSHLGTVVVPALLALADTAPRPVRGADWLAALVAGYEIGGKIGRMILDSDIARIHRPTGITGPLAAAAAGSRALGLDAVATATALAIAANTAAGYNEWAATGGSEMFFHVGFAARNAVSAVQLAATGAFASPTALDGAAGLLAAFGKRAHAASVPEPFADGFEIERVFFKPVPACNYAQSAAQAARALALRRRVAPRDIARVVVRVTRAAALYPGCDARGPFAHTLQAKMSIQYNVAAALLRGDFAERNYEPHANPDTLAVARLTSLEVDAGLAAAYPARQGAEVVVTLRDGVELRERAADVVAADADDVCARFRAAAVAALGADAAAALETAVDTLETSADAAALSRCARREGVPS
jgi:2-methylcitrate dehydratase PrpD